MTIVFDVEELWALKRAHPDWVILLGDKAKNPARLVGSWKELTAQSMSDLQTLVDKAQRSEMEAWNFGPRTGLGGLVCLDWDWEFLAYRWIKHFGDRAQTLTFRTPNLGFRMLFTSSEKENSSPFKRGLHMEFENGGYVAVGGYAEDLEGYRQPYVKVTDVPIRSDNSVIADTKVFLASQLERYDFLRFNCISSAVDCKHIRLDHNQRLALVQFMLSKEFLDDEIHDFFKTVYQPDGMRDYDFAVTQGQIVSARGFRERGGRPNPCVAKANPETGHISTPLFQIFGFDQEKCVGCVRRQKVKHDAKEVKEKELEEALDRLRSEFIFKTPTDLKDLYYYDDGIYRLAQCKLEELLEHEFGARASVHFVSEVIEHLKRGSYVERSEFNRYTGLVPVLNGLLDLKTLELKPFSPEVIYTYKLNVRYDPTAQCPKWLKFLGEILPLEDHALLQEYLGYCVLPAMPKHKMMWFYGGGRNGKGTVIRTLEAIIGQDNCSFLELGEFDGEHRFAVAGLYGKLINVSSEPSTVHELQTPLLKKITGEDSLDAEVKGKQKRIRFCNIAKPFVLGNEFPKVNDTSVAFQDRTLILKFPNQFIGKAAADDIERQWLNDPAEVAGIFNWMLAGLHRLGINGEFTLSKTTKEVTLEFKRTSDPIGAWIEDRCTFDIEGFVTRKAAFEDYKNYADEELGKAPETERKFYQRLRDTPKVKDYDSKRNGRGFKGIQLKKANEEKLEAVQTELMASAGAFTTGAAGAAGLDNCKKISDGATVFENCVEEAVASVATAVLAANEPALEPQNQRTPDLVQDPDSGKLVLQVLPSRGEPCEGATIAGTDCAYASEFYLIDPQEEKSCWCKTHLHTVLSGYDQKSYHIQHGTTPNIQPPTP